MSEYGNCIHGHEYGTFGTEGDPLALVLSYSETGPCCSAKHPGAMVMDFVKDLPRGVTLEYALDGIESGLYKRALKRHEGNIVRASRELGVHRNTFRARCDRHDIDIDEYRWSS